MRLGLLGWINITDWSAEALWKSYTQLTEAEAAFRIHKSDLSIRPVWYQKQKRVERTSWLPRLV